MQICDRSMDHEGPNCFWTLERSRFQILVYFTFFIWGKQPIKSHLFWLFQVLYHLHSREINHHILFLHVLAWIFACGYVAVCAISVMYDGEAQVIKHSMWVHNFANWWAFTFVKIDDFTLELYNPSANYNLFIMFSNQLINKQLIATAQVQYLHPQKFLS